MKKSPGNSPSASPSSSETADAILSHRQITLVLAGLVCAMFLSTLDQTIVGTAMRTIADDLHGLDLQAWVVAAFLVTSTIATPILGKLSDLFGRRPLFIASITIFAIGSLLSGLATSMGQLIGFRALQGVGAGGLIVLPLSVIGDVLAPRQRARYQGYFLAVITTATFIGPLLGGVFAGASSILWIAGWRWAFLVNVPISLISLVAVARNLHYSFSPHRGRVDWWGCALIIAAIVPLLVVAEQGSRWGWGSGAAVVCYVAAAVGIGGFLVVEHAAQDSALLPFDLFRSAAFSLASVTGVLLGFAMLGGLTVIPLYLQIARGAPPATAGLMLLPTVVGMMAATIGGGRLIARTGRFGALPAIGAGLMAGSLGLMGAVEVTTPLWQFMVGMAIYGTGVGLLMQTLTLLSQNTVGLAHMGVATSTATFVRSIGGVFGAAILVSVVFSRLTTTVPAAFADPAVQRGIAAALADPTVLADPSNTAILAVIRRAGTDGDATLAAALSSDSSFLAHADPRLTAPFVAGFTDATAAALLVAGIAGVLALAITLFLRPGRLRDLSALQEAAEQSASQSAEPPRLSPRPASH